MADVSAEDTRNACGPNSSGLGVNPANWQRDATAASKPFTLASKDQRDGGTCMSASWPVPMHTDWCRSKLSADGILQLAPAQIGAGGVSLEPAGATVHTRARMVVW